MLKNWTLKSLNGFCYYALALKHGQVHGLGGFHWHQDMVHLCGYFLNFRQSLSFHSSF
jgi:hypothetical protein